MGDLLFAMANLARKLGVEPESALRKANQKFTTRFQELERRLEAGGPLGARREPRGDGSDLGEGEESRDTATAVRTSATPRSTLVRPWRAWLAMAHAARRERVCAHTLHAAASPVASRLHDVITRSRRRLASSSTRRSRHWTATRGIAHDDAMSMPSQRIGSRSRAMIQPDSTRPVVSSRDRRDSDASGSTSSRPRMRHCRYAATSDSLVTLDTQTARFAARASRRTLVDRLLETRTQLPMHRDATRDRAGDDCFLFGIRERLPLSVHRSYSCRPFIVSIVPIVPIV